MKKAELIKLVQEELESEIWQIEAEENECEIATHRGAAYELKWLLEKLEDLADSEYQQKPEQHQ